MINKLNYLKKKKKNYISQVIFALLTGTKRFAALLFLNHSLQEVFLNHSKLQNAAVVLIPIPLQILGESIKS